MPEVFEIVRGVMDSQENKTGQKMVSAKTETIDKITETIYNILKGKKLENIAIPADYPDDEVRQLMEYVNMLVRDYNECTEFVYSLARGELDCVSPKDKMLVTQSAERACTGRLSMRAFQMLLTGNKPQLPNNEFAIFDELTKLFVFEFMAIADGKESDMVPACLSPISPAKTGCVRIPNNN